MDILKEAVRLTGFSSGELGDMQFSEVLELINDKEQEARHKKAQAKRSDNKFCQAVKEFFSPYGYLNRWFSENEILDACAECLELADITQTITFPTGADTVLYEFPKDGLKHMATEYTLTEWSEDREKLPKPEHNICHIFLAENPYQPMHHGKVVRRLLFGRCPQLEQFHLSFPGLFGSFKDGYKIYIEGLACIPFEALMEKDIKAIKEANSQFWAGKAPEESAKAWAESDRCRKLFETIRSM